MKSFSDINLHPSTSDLRGLRWTLLIGGTLTSAMLALWAHRQTAAAISGGAIAFLLALSLVPGLARLVYVAWMGLGVALGMVTTPVMLSLIWVGLFVPLAVFFRLLGRDPLRRRRGAIATSYWVAHETPSDVRTYFRQF